MFQMAKSGNSAPLLSQTFFPNNCVFFPFFSGILILIWIKLCTSLSLVDTNLEIKEPTFL